MNAKDCAELECTVCGKPAVTDVEGLGLCLEHADEIGSRLILFHLPTLIPRGNSDESSSDSVDSDGGGPGPSI